MAPSRKLRSVNRRYAYVNEVSPNKHAENANKDNQKKRKSDLLGPQWNKKELERFYAAYRKYGKNWKKVAKVIPNRSAEMVEALYSTNKAYLSLPDGAASVAGLVAMMIDHYGVLDGSDSDEESSEERGESEPQKRARGKFLKSAYKESNEHFLDLSQPHAVASNDGCLPLLKNARSGILNPAVRKRTPRVPFSYHDNDKEKYSSPAKQNVKINTGTTDDDVTHEIAIALTKASQRSGSPQVYRMPNRKEEAPSPSLLQDSGRTRIAPKTTMSKVHCTNFNDDGGKLSLGRKGSAISEYSGGRSYSGKISVASAEFQDKGKKQYVKKLEVENGGKDHLDDIKEASYTTDERKLGALKRIRTEIMDAKSARSLSKGPRKKSRKSLFGDEDSSFDALQTLADMSLMMRSTNDVTESSAEKEENFDGASRYKMNDNHETSAVEETASRSPKLEKAKAGSHIITGMHRRKLKSPLKACGKEDQSGTHPSDNQTAATENAKRSACKGKRSSHNSVNIQGKHSGFTLSDINTRREVNDSARPTTGVPSRNQFNLPEETRTEHNKTNIQKPVTVEHRKKSEEVSDNRSSKPVPLLRSREPTLKERLSNCLSGHQARRWCTFEWFYSAIDYPWFAKSEFVEYLNHVALGHVPRLTRVEWGVIKGSLGRPRRFSEHFLREEREKLNQYRESVRTHYTELRIGTRVGLPTDLALPLSVGQHIIAIHPRTRELHSGIVLAVEHSTYRVQFVQPDLGVESVMDIDCMPLNPTENIPASLRRHGVAKKIVENLNELKTNTNEKLIEGKTDDIVKVGENLVNTESHSSLSPAEDIDQLLMCREPPVHAHRPKQADIEVVSELTRALDKKEAVVFELRHMNDVLENKKDGDSFLKDSEAFKKQFAAVVLQLIEVNEQVSSALICLRERNTYHGASPPILKPVAQLNDHKGRSSSVTHYNYQECGSQVDEILESSRITAQKVVGVAIQAISSLEKMGENWEGVEDAIDFVNSRLSEADTEIASVRKPPTKASSDQLPAAASTLTTHSTDPKLNSLSNQNELKIPSELIAHCVSTLLMIQKCTERQFPPSEVARVLDSAVTSLQPLCSKNLSVHEEIQKFMGIIRTQILALIPT